MQDNNMGAKINIYFEKKNILFNSREPVEDSRAPSVIHIAALIG